MLANLRKCYEVHSAEYERKRKRNDFEFEEILKFLAQAFKALEEGELNAKKQRPLGLNEDLLAKSTLESPYYVEIVKHVWFTSANMSAEMLTKGLINSNQVLEFLQFMSQNIE